VYIIVQQSPPYESGKLNFIAFFEFEKKPEKNVAMLSDSSLFWMFHLTNVFEHVLHFKTRFEVAKKDLTPSVIHFKVG